MKRCRFCNTGLKHLFVSLGLSPLANAYLTKAELNKKETFYPLDVYVCEGCFLVQLEEFERPENIFSDYAYFSSYSDSWLKHSKDYVDKMIKMFNVDKKSYVVEIASNDGYLLQYFAEKGIPVLGIEPARNVAEEAKRKGIPTEIDFFGIKTAKRLVKEGKQPDILLGNNVLAHVPNLNDFVQGLKIFLKPQGIVTLEFPHLMQLMDQVQFDTIYHEHFSYFSFTTLLKVFSAHKLTIFDVEELPTHGGSLRIYLKHQKDNTKNVSPRVVELEQREANAGFKDIGFYLDFSKKVEAVKPKIIQLLSEIKKEGKTVAGYGAPAKGNTLLNYCGINTDLIEYTVDRNPHKQGRYLPGSHIPIADVEKIKESKPEYLFILPWNLQDEIIKQMACIRQWGGKFIVPIPQPKVL